MEASSSEDEEPPAARGSAGGEVVGDSGPGGSVPAEEPGCVAGCVGALEGEASVDLSVLWLEKSVADTLFSKRSRDPPNLGSSDGGDVSLSAWAALSSLSAVTSVVTGGPDNESTDDAGPVPLESGWTELAEADSSALFGALLPATWLATNSVVVTRSGSSETVAADEVDLSGFVANDDDVESDDEDVADEVTSTTDALGGGDVAAVFVVVSLTVVVAGDSAAGNGAGFVVAGTDADDDLSNGAVEAVVGSASFASLCDVTVTLADDVMVTLVDDVTTAPALLVTVGVLPLAPLLTAASVTLFVVPPPFVPPTASVLFVFLIVSVVLGLTLSVLSVPPALFVAFAPATLPVEFVPPTLFVVVAPATVSVLFVPPTTLAPATLPVEFVPPTLSVTLAPATLPVEFVPPTLSVALATTRLPALFVPAPIAVLPVSVTSTTPLLFASLLTRPLPTLTTTFIVRPLSATLIFSAEGERGEVDPE